MLFRTQKINIKFCNCLNEDGYDGEAAYDGAVVSLAGEDVQRADGALHDLLHSDTVGVGAGGTSSRPLLGVLECE